MELPEKVRNVISSLTKIPGIGSKSAARHALMMTNWTIQDINEFSNSIKELASLCKCRKCNMLSDSDLCSVCNNEERKISTSLCVVETVSDCIAIENSGTFKGRYHILGGVLNPLIGIGPDELGLDDFEKRISEEKVQELILAINPSVEGDATCSYIRHLLPEEVFVERIGFGMPMGGSLEHLDSMTISKALENRKKL